MLNLNSNKLLGYALKEGQLVHISEVTGGLSCDCTCPKCGERLIAKKGEVNEHHFAHDFSSDCIGAAESALHLLAKEVISQSRELFIPELEIEASLVGVDGIELHRNNSQSAYILTYEEVLVEQAVNDYRPDLTLVLQPKIVLSEIYFGMESFIDVEVKVTHGVDDEKLDKVISAERPMIEIDVSEADFLMNREALAHWIIYHAPRQWLYHPCKERREKELFNELGLIVEEQAEQQAENKSLKSLKVKSSSHVMALGYKAGKGFSKRTGKDFEMHEIYFAAPMQTRSSSNYQLLGGAGYEQGKHYIDPALGSKLETLSYPCELLLKTGTIFSNGKLKGVVTDVEVV